MCGRCSLSTCARCAVDTHFHIFHPKQAVRDEKQPSFAILIALVAMYPLLSVAGLGLVIPLLVYVGDHAPFQSLDVLRPDHYAKLLVRVYRAWASSKGGKLKGKDL